jgi:hypothetical protein
VLTQRSSLLPSSLPQEAKWQTRSSSSSSSRQVEAWRQMLAQQP